MTDITTNTPEPRRRIAGTRGATRQSWRNSTGLRGLFAKLMDQYPDASRGELLTKYKAKVKGRGFQASPSAKPLIEEALTRVFDNDLTSWNSLMHSDEDLDDNEEAASAEREPDQRPVRRMPTRPRVTETEIAAADQLLTTLVLLDLVQPNGKKLRDCTGKECRQAGGWLVKVAERVGDRGVVGATIDEAEVASIFASSTRGR